MKNFKKVLLSGLFLLAAGTTLAQGKIKGKVIDGSTNTSLPGANVVVKGSKTGTSTDFDGKFVLNASTSSVTFTVSSVGFQSKTVTVNVNKDETKDIGTISLGSNNSDLEEVVVRSSIVDVAKDRKTPVAVSTIKAAEIQQKLGNLEFPEILANTPSVYATKSGGGFGDSRVSIRGFDQRNIAVMINGVPVNDMENSAVYWSNWAGLSDVTSAMQVQRGLGSSKLAISSVGGTINVVTKTSDMKEGGSISAMVANNNYLKTQASYNTGVMKNGLSASVLLSRTAGSMYADGTNFEGHNYFIALGYKINEKNDIQFTFTGAPQWHHQRSFASTIDTHIKYGNPATNEPNIKYNSDWGYLKGEQFSMARNFYHKPVMSLNWDLKINDKMKLSSVFYGSWGRGGGTGSIGRNPNGFKTANGLLPFNDFYAYNTGVYNAATREGTGSAAIASPSNLVQTGGQNILGATTGFGRRASINSHDWYGTVINLNTKLSDELTLDFGVDARTFVGYHFRNVSDRLGASGFLDNTDVNNPNRKLYETYDSTPSFNPFTNVKDQEKIVYNNNGYVNWYGAFTQLEYTKDKLSLFFQGAISQQGFQREDTFLYLQSDPLYKTDFKNLIGYNAKGGVNYNLTEEMNVFFNAGTYSKQPFFNAVYPNSKSLVNNNLTNEKIVGFEAGYGYKSSLFKANLNVYYTSWKDRYQRTNDAALTNVGGYYDFAGITEIHTGAELEISARPTKKLGLNAMASVGDWKYKGDITGNRYDADNNSISGGTVTTYYVDGAKVGDAAQVTASFGANYEILNRVTLDANYRYVDKLYAFIDPTKFTSSTNKGTLQLPSYGLMDAGFSYKMLVSKDKSDSVNFRVNVNNLLNTVYIAESRTNIFADDIKSGGTTYEQQGAVYNGVATANQVYFGFGRTWNFGITYKF